MRLCSTEQTVLKRASPDANKNLRKKKENICHETDRETLTSKNAVHDFHHFHKNNNSIRNQHK